MTPDQPAPEQQPLHPFATLCGSCRTAQATTCSECVRDLAQRVFFLTARHPADGPPFCLLCDVGHASACGNCALQMAAAQRVRLLEAGRPVPTWDRNDALGVGHVARGLDMAARIVKGTGEGNSNPVIVAATEQVASRLSDLADGFRGGVDALTAIADQDERDRLAAAQQDPDLPTAPGFPKGTTGFAPPKTQGPHSHT